MSHRKIKRTHLEQGVYGFLTTFRRARLLLLIPLLIIAVVVTYLESRTPVLHRESLTATVLETLEVLQTQNGSAHLARLELPDRTRIRLLLPFAPPHPATGDRVPLVAEYYEDGKTLYALDWPAWVDRAYSN